MFRAFAVSDSPSIVPPSPERIPVAPDPAPAFRETRDHFYRAEAGCDAHADERCRIDLYLPPPSFSCFPLLVWFHGGGLEAQTRRDPEQVTFARRFAACGIGVAMAGYRLSPRVRFPAYVEDAAAAVAWTVRQAPDLGADPERIFVGGHSAGGYLAALLAMDASYLRNAGLREDEVAAYFPMSAQLMTHSTVRRERGVSDPDRCLSADAAAPIHHLRADTRPIHLIIGDTDLPARLEENQFFAASLQKVAGNPHVSLLVVPERDHGTVAFRCLEPGDPAGSHMAARMKNAPVPRTSAPIRVPGQSGMGPG